MSSTNRRPKRATNRKVATVANYASLTFDGLQADAMQATSSQADWVEAAKNEFFLFQCAVKILGKNDVEMAADVQAGGPEPFLALVDSATDLLNKYKWGIKVLDSVLVRTFCGLSRHPDVSEADLGAIGAQHQDGRIAA
jgi:hypothetical protein